MHFALTALSDRRVGRLVTRSVEVHTQSYSAAFTHLSPRLKADPYLERRG